MALLNIVLYCMVGIIYVQLGSSQDIVYVNLPTTVDVDEDVTSRTLLLTLDATDANNDTLNFTLESGDTDSNFEVGLTDGEVYLIANPTLDTVTLSASYSLQIRASDGVNFTDDTLTVDINFVNQVPSVTGLPDSVLILESDLSQALVFSGVGANPDPDREGGTITYECQVTPNDGSFYCDSANGDVYNYAYPNYTASTYTIKIRLSDGTAYSAYGDLTATIQNVWADPAVINNLPNITVVLEDLAPGSEIYLVEAWDPDNMTHGENFTLVLLGVSTDASLFSFDGSTGNLTLAAPLDFETAAQHVLDFRACDVDGCAFASLTLDVTDIPEPPNATWTPMLLPENQNGPYQLIPNWNVTDPDGQVTFTWSLEASPDAASFSISASDGNLTYTGSQLDYESIQAMGIDPPELNFDVLISDGTGQTATVSVTVLIDDVNEFPPVFDPEEYEAEITEGQMYDAILYVEATDEDGGPVYGEVTYIVGAPGNDYLTVVTEPDGRGRLYTWKSVDLEALEDDDFVFLVYAYDGSSELFDTAVVRLKVADVDDFPPEITKTKYRFRVNVNADIGTQVGLVEAIDQDLKDTVTYNQIDNSSVPFFISYWDGQVVLNGELTSGQVYRLWGYAEDSSGLRSKVFEVEIETFDGVKTLVNWEIESSGELTPSEIAEFESNLKATCDPCTPVVSDSYINDNGNTVLQVYILRGNSTDDDPSYWTKEEILDKYTTDGIKTPTEQAEGLTPRGTVVSINEAYESDDWWLETVEGNITIAFLCLLGFAAISTAIAVLADRFYCTRRPEKRQYSSI